MYYFLVMVVVMVRMRMHSHTAAFLVAMLIFPFKLKRCMTNSVFLKLCSYFFFYLMSILICYNVHCSIIIMSVHAPHVDMMHTAFPK